MMKYFREDLHRRLLSADFKKQIDGIEMLQKVMFFQILNDICAFQVMNVLYNLLLHITGTSIHCEGNYRSFGHSLEVVCVAVLQIKHNRSTKGAI